MPLSQLERKLNKKRKLSSQQPSRKRVKTEHLTTDDLPWKSIPRRFDAGLDGTEGILDFEEVEGVDVVYEETEAGRVVKFNIVEAEKKPTTKKKPAAEAVVGEEEIEEVAEEPFEFDGQSLPEWTKFSLHPKILFALHDKSFSSPTPIQAASLPFALKDRDVVGVAQTGSGKTLAYGLPILHYLLSKPRPSSFRKRPVSALILAPTRELALQVSSHLNELVTSIERKAQPKEGEAGPSEKGEPQTKKRAPHVSVAAIVGGMSSQKQRRILDRGVDVLVATPGRLWDILEEDDELASGLKRLRFLVLDEADRMIEAGHFAELENILRLTLRENKDDQIPDNFGEEGMEKDEDEEEDSKEGIKDGLQTFVFSATLSKDLQRNLKKRPKGKKHYRKGQRPASTLDDLLLRLDFRDPEPEVIDLSPVGGVVSTLQEARIECLSADKDVYLYYFLLRYPGKSLVFLSSIDGIRRLLPLLELLNVKAFPLHSQLEQRQRLKNLDRFKSNPNSVLLATDIAARGLDIPSVDHVIHFQIPRTADTYIHRNGRTARAMRKGFSLLICGPEERKITKVLLNSVGRDESEIPEMSIELAMLDKLKARVQLGRKIETAQHKIKKTKHDRNWLKETAETLGVELDSDFVASDDEDGTEKRKRLQKEHEIAGLKAQLKQLLAQPLLATGISAKFITSGSRPIVDDLLAGQLNENMLGLRKADAGDEAGTVKAKQAAQKKSKQPKTKKIKTEVSEAA